MGCREFFGKYGGWLLAGLSSIGVVTTAVLAAKEAPKAAQAIKDEELRRMESFMDDAHKRFSEDPDLPSIQVPDMSLTRWEKIKIAAPIMAPSLISGGLTIGGIIGNQIINQNKQNALAMAAVGYSVLSTEYDQYRKVIRETEGEEVDAMALKMAKMRCEELEDELARLKEECGPYLYSISTIPGLIFEANPADIQAAFLHFNRNLSLRGTNDLAELYAFIGIPESKYNVDESFQYGWNDFENYTSWDCSFLDFDISEVETKNGTKVRMITMTIPPYDLTLNYDQREVNVLDHICPFDNPNKTKTYIEDLYQIWWDQVTKIDRPFVYGPNLFSWKG